MEVSCGVGCVGCEIEWLGEGCCGCCVVVVVVYIMVSPLEFEHDI